MAKSNELASWLSGHGALLGPGWAGYCGVCYRLQRVPAGSGQGGPVLHIHPNARTTPATHAEIARSAEPSGTAAQRYGISAKPCANGASLT